MKIFHHFLLWICAVFMSFSPYFLYAEEEELYHVHADHYKLNETFTNYDEAYDYFEKNKEDYDNLILSIGDRVLKMEYGIVEFKNDMFSYISETKNEDDLINGSYGIDAIYLDTSYSHTRVIMPLARELARTVGPDHLLFGSDAPWSDPAREASVVKSLGLSPDEEEMVFCGNARRLLGLNLS